jgi:hypothetical protein
MKKLSLILVAALMPLSAHAASVEDPVKAIMDVAVARSQPDSPGTDYFDKPYLNANYSKDFRTVYRAAAKYPAYDEGTSPFDYDVITSSQDGCPIKDLKIAKGKQKSGVTTVDVSFRLWDCAETAEEKAKVSKLKFDVIAEGGKPVITDIRRQTDGKWNSLVGEMQEIIEARQ